MCTHFSTRLHSWTRKDVDEGVQRPGPTPAKQLVRAAPLPQQSGDDYGRRIYGPHTALVCNEMSYACVTHTTHIPRHAHPPLHAKASGAGSGREVHGVVERRSAQRPSVDGLALPYRCAHCRALHFCAPWICKHRHTRTG